ncbi:hypothetical protein Tco_1576181 [Tanacetum coccineum]
MSRDVIMVSSTMRIPLLYRVNIVNGVKVSLARTAPNVPPVLKDPKFKDPKLWTVEEKRIRKINRLERSILIQGLPNDIYSYIDSNDTIQFMGAIKLYMHGCIWLNKIGKAAFESSSFDKETLAKVSYYFFDSEGEYEIETSECCDKTETNYGLFVDNDDDQETFHDAIVSASKIFDENLVVPQKDDDESEVVHNDYEEKDHLVNKLIAEFNQKIAKCQKRIEKANQQSKDLENQNKSLQDQNDVLNNQVNIFEEKSNEFGEQIKVKENKDYFLAHTEILE